MQTDPLVSVIMPVHNGEQLLSRSINSVIAQTYKHWELIIIDDRSADNTERLIREYAEKDHRIQYVKNTHKKGPAGARNQGLESVRGEYVAFLDHDDEWLPFHIEEMIEEFNKHDDIDWIFADSKFIQDERIVVNSAFRERWKGRGKFKTKKRGTLFVLDGKGAFTNMLHYGLSAGLQASIVRKAVFDKVRFNEGLLCGSDWFLEVEAMAKGVTFAYVDRVHLLYNLRPDSVSSSDPRKPISDKISTYEKTEKTITSILDIFSLTAKQKKIVTDQLADLYFWLVGYNCYLQLGDRRKTEEYFLKGLKLRPLNIFYWKTYILWMIRNALRP